MNAEFDEIFCITRDDWSLEMFPPLSHKNYMQILQMEVEMKRVYEKNLEELDEAKMK